MHCPVHLVQLITIYERQRRPRIRLELDIEYFQLIAHLVQVILLNLILREREEMEHHSTPFMDDIDQ